MSINRWALSYDQSIPNPGAGFAIGRPVVDRPKGAMMPAQMKSMHVGEWHPTVVNLAILIVVELVAYSAIRYLFREFLGG